jgi:hypothetical protein
MERYQIGAEIEITWHFRCEPFVARQLDRLPRDAALNAAGIVARWYY